MRNLRSEHYFIISLLYFLQAWILVRQMEPKMCGRKLLLTHQAIHRAHHHEDSQSSRRPRWVGNRLNLWYSQSIRRSVVHCSQCWSHSQLCHPHSRFTVTISLCDLQKGFWVRWSLKLLRYYLPEELPLSQRQRQFQVRKCELSFQSERRVPFVIIRTAPIPITTFKRAGLRMVRSKQSQSLGSLFIQVQSEQRDLHPKQSLNFEFASLY